MDAVREAALKALHGSGASLPLRELLERAEWIGLPVTVTPNGTRPAIVAYLSTVTPSSLR